MAGYTFKTFVGSFTSDHRHRISESESVLILLGTRQKGQTGVNKIAQILKRQ